VQDFKFVKVIRCSPKGRSCTVETEGVLEKINLSLCDYELVEPEQGASDGSDDTSHGDGLLSTLMAALDSTDPDELLRPSATVSHVAKEAVKEVVESIGDSMQGLHVDGFDAEQIWVQLDALSKTAMRRVKRVLQRSVDISSVIPEDVEEALDELLGNIEGAGNLDNGDEYSDEDDPGEDEVGADDGPEEGRRAPDSRQQRASWEDEYLNLDEMEAFLREAEDEYARKDGSDQDSDEEALDSVLDDMMNETGGRPRATEQDGIDLGSDPLANAKYEDFFGRRKKKVHFVEDDEDDELDDEEEDGLEDYGDDQLEDDQLEDDQLSEDELEQAEKHASRHELRLGRLSNKIQKMEEEALGAREWYMRGEVSGTHRPMNSALEVDLDFETTMKPPPQPTEETTQSLEDLIKQRIADHRFDDVVAIEITKEEKKKTTVELDDVKSTKGLGQIYEDEYLAQTHGASDDKEQPIRELARKQFIALCAKLDQLSHGQFRPLPAIEEVTFKVDVPAIMMEEATPAFVSNASMRKPEEVFRPGQSLQKSVVVEDDEGEEKVVTTREGMMQPGGVTKSEAELTREDRKRRRAANKRASKKRKMAKDAEQIQRALAAGKAPVPGRKSEAANQMLRKLADSATKSSDKNFTKSREVFARMNALQDGTGTAKPDAPAHKAMHLKL
jgi:U3 small nucleolar RNA-associated protein MPP10